MELNQRKCHRLGRIQSFFGEQPDSTQPPIMSESSRVKYPGRSQKTKIYRTEPPLTTHMTKKKEPHRKEKGQGELEKTKKQNQSFKSSKKKEKESQSQDAMDAFSI